MTSVKSFHHPIKGQVTIEHLDEAEALLILSTFPGLKLQPLKRLIEHFGCAAAILDANLTDVLQIIGKNERLATYWPNWREEKLWQKNIELVERHHITLLPYTHSSFPKSLLKLKDCPPLLYLQGNHLELCQKSIAIVGTRQASIYGIEMARNLACQLASCGYTIVSGLARGIDTAAHLGALEAGKTVGIIGSGLANIYPKENWQLAEQIVQQGALLSEQPMMAPPDRLNFPQRNRLVAGLSMAIVLIEAPCKSGAMITMQMGASQNKKLFAIPGRIDCENFRGNHFLLKSGQATLIENAQDILNELGAPMPKGAEEKNYLGPPLDKEELKLLKQMPKHEVSVDELLILTAISAPQLNALLMSLLLKGAIKEFPGRFYKKKS